MDKKQQQYQSCLGTTSELFLQRK